MDSVLQQQQHQQEHRRARRGDEYHIRACRCDLTNACVSTQVNNEPMTRQTELFLCLHTESHEVEFLEVTNLTLTGNNYDSQPIQQGIPSNLHQTWITRTNGGNNNNNNAWTIRTRMDSEFFLTLLPSSQDVYVVAEGMTLLRKANAKETTTTTTKVESEQDDKRKPRTYKNKRHNKKNKQQQRQHETVPPVRYLQQQQQQQVSQNVSVPFRVDILVRLDESLVEVYTVSYAPIVILVLTLLMCCFSVACRMSADRRQQKQRRKLRKRRADASSITRRCSSTNGERLSRATSTNGERARFSRSSVMDDDTKEEFDDEPSFVSAHEPFEENIAHIVRV